MADENTTGIIYQVKMPSGNIYDIGDKWARDKIEELSKYTKYVGVSITPITDGGSENPTIKIDGQDVVIPTSDLHSGDIITYGSKEFIWNGASWQEFGDLDSLGAFAHVDEGTATFTPSGEISTPTISVELNTTEINSITSAGTMAQFNPTVTANVLDFGWQDGSIPTMQQGVTVASSVKSSTSTQPTFTGTEQTITVMPKTT